MGGWLVLLVIALSFPGPRAWADTGRDRSDRLCEKADRSERDAREAERKSEERQRFLKGKGGTGAAPRTVPFQDGEAAVVRQSAKARIAQARATLPQLRQAAAASSQDQGVVPGYSRYFAQMESGLNGALQAAEACLDNPGNCIVPPIPCPSPPGLPAFPGGGNAAFVRQVQQSYSQAANAAQQSCRKLNSEILGELERFQRAGRTAGTKGELPVGAESPRFGDADLYLRRADSLMRDASQYRREADRESGIRGYCGVRGASRGPGVNRVAFDALKAAAARERKAEADFPLDAKVIDLKEAWEKKWGTGQALDTSNVSVSKLNARGGDTVEAVPGRDKKDDVVSMEQQKKLIDQRLEEPNKWSSGLYDSLKTNAPPLPYKKFDELQAGDVLLIAPEKENLKDLVTGWGINKTDKALSGDTVSEASHTVIYLKEMNGRKMFMDNIPGEGVRIVPEDYILQKYGMRETEVAKLAQPLNPKEAELLYAEAKKLRTQNLEKMQGNNWFDTTNYGVWNKENVVCAEADWALIKAAGRNVPASDDRIKRALGIDFSPADFYGNEQYFLVSPFVMKK